MKTFLFAWNPTKWDWKSLENSISQIQLTGSVTERWSLVSHKKIEIGDRAFLVVLGKEPKGIMGSGFVTSNPFPSPHWDGSGRLVKRVTIDFDVILNPNEEPILGLDILNQGKLSSVHWTPQASGIEINSEVTDELEAIWFDFLSTQQIRYNPFKKHKSSSQVVYSEGRSNQVRVTTYERNPHARNKCIEYYGLSCQVCKFNFEQTYGLVGKDFIHVHHLQQISKIGETHEVNPITDLRPVCPNCHAMIHKRKEPYTIEEMRKMIEKTKE